MQVMINVLRDLSKVMHREGLLLLWGFSWLRNENMSDTEICNVYLQWSSVKNNVTTLDFFIYASQTFMVQLPIYIWNKPNAGVFVPFGHLKKLTKLNTLISKRLTAWIFETYIIMIWHIVKANQQ